MASKVEEGAATSGGAKEQEKGAAAELPTFYISHGGGPCFFMKPEDIGGMRDMGPGSKLAQSLASFAKGLRPKALLVISAHWQGPKVMVTGGTKKKLLFDYYGFPDYTYKLKWPAPGAPAVTKRVQGLLSKAGIAHGVDSERGFDHGVFVPLKLAFPDASIPTVAMSLRHDLDPAFHVALGRALRPLRREGVLIIASGFSYHGMAARAPHHDKVRGAEAFDTWLHDALKQASPAREAALEKWDAAPGARLSHPREEHLIPLHVAAGAATGDTVSRFYNQPHMGGCLVSMFRFGGTA